MEPKKIYIFLFYVGKIQEELNSFAVRNEALNFHDNTRKIGHEIPKELERTHQQQGEFTTLVKSYSVLFLFHTGVIVELLVPWFINAKRLHQLKIST